MVADFVMSKHALERAVDMAVTGEEIRDCWERPRNQHYSRRSDSWSVTRGRICLCYRFAEDGVPIITTVLWATAAAWADDLEVGVLAGRHGTYDGVRKTRKAMKRKGIR